MAIRKKNFFSRNKLFATIFSSDLWPFTTLFLLLIVMFVTVRMKNVEQTYSLNKIQQQIEKASIINKELKAERAQLLSDVNLRRISANHNLKEPGPEQIILIPE